ncbi:glycosyltransferase [Olivibacter sp. SDN3]|uniref:glycosyltransferase n=1 Tax=Olivibacter sp. SDN3 TaxID=2764720 RepID=UPI001651133A|nr:glycosyltransferase [Olivibacter sp. SDN3]QNL51717.1 glycosyltransferase [Olivibacter sp. SDN3]
MKIVFFAHPAYQEQDSMIRFTEMLCKGMTARGHEVELWQPKASFVEKFGKNGFVKKWLSYIDMFLLFPQQVKNKIRSCSEDTLFILTDHALGPWIPLVKNRLHMVHCHDFLAQRSAANEIDGVRISFTGKIYQQYIRFGYTRAKHFISVSSKTDEDLKRFMANKIFTSTVVYNGLNRVFTPQDPIIARKHMSRITGIPLSDGYLMHIGGNAWYKNRLGVIDIYNAWRKFSNLSYPLLMIGKSPDKALEEKHLSSPYRKDIIFLTDFNDNTVRTAYAGAQMLLFPSLAEGFGWPIVEAQASGCLVLTTEEAPMTEVAASSGIYIKKMPNEVDAISLWAIKAAKTVDDFMRISKSEREKLVSKGILNAHRFDSDRCLDQIEKAYLEVCCGQSLVNITSDALGMQLQN